MNDAVVDQNLDALPAAKAAVLQTLEKYNDELARLEEDYHRKRQQIHSYIRSTHRQWNAMAPISRLPSELLSIIFEAFVTEYCEARMNGYSRWNTSCSEWLIILHICHHWRNVALGSPRLWTRIELRCEPYVQLALAHSGDLPLTVFVRKSPLSRDPQRLLPDPIVQSLFPEFRRLRFARFRVTRSVGLTFEVAHKEGIKLEAPILETLILTIGFGARTQFPLLSEMALPSLTSLTIQNGPFMLVKSLLRHTLTTLEISSSPDLKPSTLAEALVGLPLLQRLVLSPIGEEDADSHLGQTPSWCHAIPLLHLKYLYLSGSIHSFGIVYLMECLYFPVNTEIIFSMATDQDAPIVEQYEQVLPRVMSKALVSNMRTRTKGTQTVVPRVIEVPISQTSCPSLDVALWPTLGLWDSESPSETNSTATQRLRLIVATSMENAAIVHFFDLVDLWEVVVLDLEVDFPPKVWMRAFRNRALPKLQELILRRFPVVEVLEAISSPTSSQSAVGNKSQCYLFPTLKTLKLFECEFRGRPGKILERDGFPRIIKALHARAKGGYKLEKLEIMYPINLSREEDIDALRDPQIANSVEIEPGYAEDCTSDENELNSEESDTDDDDVVNVLGEQIDQD